MYQKKYIYGVPADSLKVTLEKWLKNPAWREYYETAPSELCRLVISMEFWESEYESETAANAIKIMEERLSADDWRHLYRYCGNNPRKEYIHDRIMDLELKDQFDLLTDIRVSPEKYYPLVDHAERHYESRTEAGNVNIGWNVGLLEGKRPWFGECWSADGITMLTYFISTGDMEDSTPEQLKSMLEESGIVKFTDPERDNTPAVQKYTDGKGNEFFSVNITVGVEDETYTTGDSGVIHSFRELNRFNEKVFSEKTENPLYPCHLYGIQDAKKAYEAVDAAWIKGYGERLALEDGTVLHEYYPDWHDEGGRDLTRCNVCGGLMLTQYSMAECPYWDDPDLYFRDCIPVATVEEADLLNILWDEKELKENACRHLQRSDMSRLWTEGKDPVPNDPEELKEKIREKYAGLKPEQKVLLEKLMAEAGKIPDNDEPLPEEEIALGKEYNRKGWELQTGENPDTEEAISWYEKAAELGNSTAMVNLGNIYEEQGDLRKAFELYGDASGAGDDTGRFNLGRMFFHGEGVEQSYGTAYGFFRELYEREYPGVCLYMGLYEENGFTKNGFEEKPDYGAAIKYYEQGIEEGDAYCPVNLGRMYCMGIGVPADLKKGFELYRLGYERGDALAATNLGYCYEVGQGVRKNRKKAVAYYREAAEAGEENAMEALKRLGIADRPEPAAEAAPEDAKTDGGEAGRMNPEYETAMKLVESKKVWRFEPQEWAEEQWEPFEALPLFCEYYLDVLVTNPLNSCHPLGGRVYFSLVEGDLDSTKFTLAGEEAQRNHIEYGKGPYHGHWTKQDEENLMVEAAQTGDPSVYGEMNEEEKAEYERLRKAIREFDELCEREIWGKSLSEDTDLKRKDGQDAAEDD